MGYTGQPWVKSLRRQLRQSSRTWEERASLKPEIYISGHLERKSKAVLACLSYAGCSIMLTLANKSIFSENKLNFPWMLLGLQSVVVALMLMVFFSIRSDDNIISTELVRQMFLPCFFLTLFIFTNARALRYISLPVLTVVKSLAPMGVALTERIVFKENVSLGTYASMLLILSGNAITVLHDVEFILIGYIWAGVNVIMNIAYVVSLRYCLSDKFTSAEKTLHSNLLACAFIFPLAVLFGEPSDFIVEIGKTSLRFRLLFILSCLLAAGIGTSVFMVIKTASGSTLSFVGASNKVFVVVLGALIFDARISPMGWIGVGMGIAASIVFAFSKAKGSGIAGDRREHNSAGYKRTASVESEKLETVRNS